MTTMLDKLEIAKTIDKRGLPAEPWRYVKSVEARDMAGVLRHNGVFTWYDRESGPRCASFYYAEGKGWIYNGEHGCPPCDECGRCGREES
jgi:hypothetical protein